MEAASAVYGRSIVVSEDSGNGMGLAVEIVRAPESGLQIKS